jgi:hypothetical protein
LAIRSLSDLQGLVLAVNALQGITPRDAIRLYDGSNTTPLVATYAGAGVTGVSATNLALINSAMAHLTPEATDTLAELQGVVDAANSVLALADGGSSAGTPLTESQFNSLGVPFTSTTNSANGAAKAALLSSVIDALSPARVNSISELQALAAAVSAVVDAASGGSAPTVEQLKALGLSGVSRSNLAAVVSAIAASNDNGTEIDSWSELH